MRKSLNESILSDKNDSNNKLTHKFDDNLNYFNEEVDEAILYDQYPGMNQSVDIFESFNKSIDKMFQTDNRLVGSGGFNLGDVSLLEEDLDFQDSNNAIDQLFETQNINNIKHYYDLIVILKDGKKLFRRMSSDSTIDSAIKKLFFPGNNIETCYFIDPWNYSNCFECKGINYVKTININHLKELLLLYKNLIDENIDILVNNPLEDSEQMLDNNGEPFSEDVETAYDIIRNMIDSGKKSITCNYGEAAYLVFTVLNDKQVEIKNADEILGVWNYQEIYEFQFNVKQMISDFAEMFVIDGPPEISSDDIDFKKLNESIENLFEIKDEFQDLNESIKNKNNMGNNEFKSLNEAISNLFDPKENFKNLNESKSLSDEKRYQKKLNSLKITGDSPSHKFNENYFTDVIDQILNEEFGTNTKQKFEIIKDITEASFDCERVGIVNGKVYLQGFSCKIGDFTKDYKKSFETIRELYPWK